VLHAVAPVLPEDDAQARQWLEQRFKVYRIESPEGDPAGWITGYFRALVEGQPQAHAQQRVPLYAAPGRPGHAQAVLDAARSWTRCQPRRPRSRAARSPMSKTRWTRCVLQVQGSGRLRITEADGSARLVRWPSPAQRPALPLGRPLADRPGRAGADEANWPTIKDWARRNPKRVNEALWQNPRTVFFREEPLPDPALGPRGAQGVPLTPGRSIAVDPLAVPYGTPVWLDATEPLSSRPLQRLALAQDTGGAIVGAVRADYFWGWGDEAENQAGAHEAALARLGAVAEVTQGSRLSFSCSAWPVPSGAAQWPASCHWSIGSCSWLSICCTASPRSMSARSAIGCSKRKLTRAGAVPPVH
jgi:membrane-bound lytic murein transglycosylase A